MYVGCSDGFLLLYDLEIARETALRAQVERRKLGLLDLEKNTHLTTRSGLSGAHASLRRVSTSHPIASKLIDSLFGATLQRSGHTQPSDPDADQDTRFYDAPSTRRPPLTSSARQPEQQQQQQRVRAKALASRTAHPLTAPPGAVSAHERDVNRRRLEASLKCSGVYPKKYRLLVWRFLLRLPKNEEAFRSLVAKGKHPAFVRLSEQYPLRNARLARRLHRVLSAIAFWCPAFGEVRYLPALVYPFVKVFRENDLAAFEASVSVLLHWGGDFLQSLPHAPASVLHVLDRELQRRDPQLYTHFQQHQITADVYGWSLLQTIFTEVLSEDEWLTLWDHLFTHVDTPLMLNVAVLAYLSYFRTALLSACDRVSIDQFFHQQNAMNVQSFVQLMLNLSQSVDMKVVEAPSKADPTDVDPQNPENGDAHHAVSYWPLPRGQYPAFARYPKFVVDFQISVRYVPMSHSCRV